MTVEGGEEEQQLGNGDPVEIWVRKIAQGVSDHRAAVARLASTAAALGSFLDRAAKARPKPEPSPVQPSFGL